jgi:2-succinyl-6-hydroxy-2,4-cyclohexadiene-1-carboxylate synthase
VGATARIEDERERAARRAADERMAEEIERDGADAFLERWLSHPMFGHLSEPGPRRRDASVLAACLRRLGTGTQEPLWDRLPALRMPVLVLAGDQDAKFTAIGRRMAEAVGDNAVFATVPDAGHAAHLEQPAAFRRLVEAFLARP